ncbi:uncharacterized protein PAC_12619 [Phialocephala subalpina]|uniref:NACHT domain-containing protein n=1 Tax=Phialocephala subalpina TaxID=576137 RepID=A0A1L7XCH6_9HELO|nr:uncharacterized protein PAC_12619 [Phialocephala subalpina]
MASTAAAQATSEGDAGPKELFQRVFTTFRNSLTEDEKREFQAYPDSVSMLASVKQVFENHPLRRSQLGRLFQKLGDLAGRLAPYFETVNTLVSSHPEYAALVWGTLRFLFTLGAQYVGFIEKLAEMFEKITSTLPRVEEYVSVLKARSEKLAQPLPSRLTMALACMYVDLTQCCQHICKLFVDRRGSRFRAMIIIKDLCWQPFDIRFNDFLRSFNQHTISLGLELALNHASNVVQEFDLLQEKVGQTEQLMQTLRSEISSAEHARREKEENIAANESMRRLLAWIKPPDWHESFDDASKRLSGTCQWVFDEPHYKTWEGQDPNGSDNCQLLLVQGKPGYGKTHLCASLIERLKYRIEFDKTMPSEVGDDSRLAFYFLDKRQPQTHNSIGSFRSILAQLLQANKEDRHLLDLACFAMGESVHPEAVAALGATKDEVLSLITIILQRLDGMTLVFDGDPGSTNSRIVLFCRPDLDIPRVLFDKASRIRLSSQHNLADITAFMLYNLERLVDDGLLECHIDLRSLATSVLSRADGMFLWIRLLIDYLRNTFTLDDRMDVLSNPIHLEGLDQLYHATLQRLQQRLPVNARETVQSAFAFVAGALRPLHVDEFRAAITIAPNKNASSKNTIPNIEHVLTRMSGALLELASDCTYSFEFWAEHCTIGLDSFAVKIEGPETSTLLLLIQQIGEFICSKDRVTTWLEASWLFGLPPELSTLVSSLGQLLLLGFGFKGQSEIWNRSISNFTPSDFWVKTPGAAWKHLKGAVQEQDKAILVESRTLEGSMELGLIKVLVPRDILDLSQYNSRCTLGWRASYEVWSLRTFQVLFRLSLDIAPEKVQKLIDTGSIGYMEDSVPRLKELEFHFPVAFGPNFRSVLILDYLIHIQELQESEIGPDLTMNCRFNVVDIAGNGYGAPPETEKYLLADDAYSLLLSPRTGGAMVSTRKGVIGMPGTELPALQTSNDIVVGRNKGGLNEASVLRQYSDSVVLQTIVEDGTARQAQLSRVPRELHSNEPVLLRGTDHRYYMDIMTRITWIKPPQPLYSFEEVVKDENPVLLERSTETIPQISTRQQIQLPGGDSDGKQNIRSSADSQDLTKRRF